MMVKMGIRSPDQVVYILATAWLESHGQFDGVCLVVKSSAERHGEREYGPNGRRASEARAYGNKTADGAKYMGRGYATDMEETMPMSKLLQDSGISIPIRALPTGTEKMVQTIDLVTITIMATIKIWQPEFVFGMDGGHYAQNGGLDTIYLKVETLVSRLQNAKRLSTVPTKMIADNAVTIANVLRNGDAWVDIFTIVI